MGYGRPSDYQRIFHSPSNSGSVGKAKIRDLEDRIEKLELVCESLWEMLKEKCDYDETDLIERMTEIDLSDGKFDGKKRRSSSIKCSKCQRKNSKRHNRCMYCGKLFLIGPFE